MNMRCRAEDVPDECLQHIDIIPEALSRRISDDSQMGLCLRCDNRGHRLQKAQNILMGVHPADVNKQKCIVGNAIARASLAAQDGIVQNAEDGIGRFGHHIDTTL